MTGLALELCGIKTDERMSQTIFITGASTGIGRETARYFLAKGWNVVATMRDPRKETELTKHKNALVTRLDVLDLATIQQAVQEAISRFGKVDVLLNNAGYGAYGPLESFPRERILRQFDTNVIGLLDVTRALLPHFRWQKSGLVINVSSMGGRLTFPLGSLYHGTKFAVEGISESLRYEVEQFGGQVKVVEPGMIATDFAGRSFDFSHDPAMTEYQKIVQQITTVMPEMTKSAAPSSVVAEVIYTAATDGKRKLRYLAGKDAKMYAWIQRLFGYGMIEFMNRKFFKL